jgi:hypothetical protein
MATELNVCSGCQYPRREGMIFVLTSLGVLCEGCVSRRMSSWPSRAGVST